MHSDSGLHLRYRKANTGNGDIAGRLTLRRVDHDKRKGIFCISAQAPVYKELELLFGIAPRPVSIEMSPVAWSRRHGRVGTIDGDVTRRVEPAAVGAVDGTDSVLTKVCPKSES